MENIDKVHFVVNMDNGRTLGFWGDTLVKYGQMALSGDPMTMVVQISRGRQLMVELLC